MENENKLTEEQEWQILWEQCLEIEKKMNHIKTDCRDKGIDWDYERYIFDKNNPKNYK